MTWYNVIHGISWTTPTKRKSTTKIAKWRTTKPTITATRIVTTKTGTRK